MVFLCDESRTRGVRVWRPPPSCGPPVICWVFLPRPGASPLSSPLVVFGSQKDLHRCFRRCHLNLERLKPQILATTLNNSCGKSGRNKVAVKAPVASGGHPVKTRKLSVLWAVEFPFKPRYFLSDFLLLCLFTYSGMVFLNLGSLRRGGRHLPEFPNQQSCCISGGFSLPTEFWELKLTPLQAARLRTCCSINQQYY